ncbi:unnamed protein product [Caretta caretta]
MRLRKGKKELKTRFLRLSSHQKGRRLRARLSASYLEKLWGRDLQRISMQRLPLQQATLARKPDLFLSPWIPIWFNWT